MFKSHSCNMTNKEAYIRASIASILMLYAFVIHSFILGTLAIVVFYTAFTKFCFAYYIFKINTRFSKENYYLSLLPKHRTSPLFIFNAKGEILFANDSSKRIFSEVVSIESLGIHNYSEILQKNQKESVIYKQKETYYQVEIIPVIEESLILTYFTDVSEVMQLNNEIEETQREIIYAMGEIGETRSKETGNHVKRVALYSKQLALLYGLPFQEANILHMASPMHDIGKVGIPDAILNAPRKLSTEEFEIMKTHAQLGYNMLKHSNKEILKAAAIVAHEHHEKFDGSGYPQGKQGEDIHIYGRITAVADVFDALGSERIYKKAWELEDILTLFKNESGKHFDPKLIALFLENLELFLIIREKFKDLHD